MSTVYSICGFLGVFALFILAVVWKDHPARGALAARTAAALLALGLVAAVGTAHAGPNDHPERWFRYLDASVGASVLPDSSIDCDGADGKRYVASRASLVANVYQYGGLTVDARLWDHVGCSASLDGGQAFGGPGLSVTYRLWAR